MQVRAAGGRVLHQVLLVTVRHRSGFPPSGPHGTQRPCGCTDPVIGDVRQTPAAMLISKPAPVPMGSTQDSAAHSVTSPPPGGEGLGVGVAVGGHIS